jgi:hypothetical protein
MLTPSPIMGIPPRIPCTGATFAESSAQQKQHRMQSMVRTTVAPPAMMMIHVVFDSDGVVASITNGNVVVGVGSVPMFTVVAAVLVASRVVVVLSGAAVVEVTAAWHDLFMCCVSVQFGRHPSESNISKSPACIRNSHSSHPAIFAHWINSAAQLAVHQNDSVGSTRPGGGGGVGCGVASPV